ncbi:MAG: gfo/Idh/MocA family oxidoreductase [Phycisphaera sp.]|nr:gfo/Idh/MocA family oxidoreductase [Phycisphaera sp.]
MTRVGVIGLGMMGRTHLDVYTKLPDVQVVALADIDAERLHGRTQATGNIDGQARGGGNLADAKKYDEGKKLIRDKNVEVVDICLTTPMHLAYARAAMRAGKHVLVEKPLARTYRDAKKLADLTEHYPSLAMPAQCMRFWPGWTNLKQAITDHRYGKVLSATFRRLGGHPGGDFYSNGELCGGAILDLHIHDTDFVNYCFGLPDAVSSHGYTTVTGEPDHVVTAYHYNDKTGPLVVAEGGWSMAKGFGFKMLFTVNFEHATLDFDLARPDKLLLTQPGQKTQPVPLDPGMGYEYEIKYFLDCVRRNEAPKTVTLHDAAIGVAIVEAERKSVLAGGKRVKVKI